MNAPRHSCGAGAGLGRSSLALVARRMASRTSRWHRGVASGIPLDAGHCLLDHSKETEEDEDTQHHLGAYFKPRGRGLKRLKVGVRTGGWDRTKRVGEVYPSKRGDEVER